MKRLLASTIGRFVAISAATCGVAIAANFVNDQFLIAAGGIAAWGTMEWVLWRKRVLRREQDQLRLTAKQEQQRLQAQIDQIPDLLTKIEQTQATLQRSQQEQHLRKQQFNQKIAQLQAELAQKEQKQQARLQQALIEQAQAQAQLQEREQAIATLQQQIANQQASQQATMQALEQLQTRLATVQQQQTETDEQLQEREQAIAALQQQIVDYQQEQHQQQQALEQLKQDQSTQEVQAQQEAKAFSQRLEQLAIEKAEAEQREQDAIETYETYVQLEQDLLAEQDSLKQQITDLENQVAILKHTQTQLLQALDTLQDYVAHREELLEPTSHSYRQRTIDLSPYRIALVGGHQKTCAAVIRELCTKHGLQQYAQVAPHTEEAISRKSVQAKIQHCDLVVIITPYMGHDLSGIVCSLHQDGALRGEILRLNCSGKSGIIREILNYYSQDHDKCRSKFKRG